MPQHLSTAWRTTKPSLDRFWGTATTDGCLIPCRGNSHRLGQFSRPWADSEDPNSLPSNSNVLLLSTEPWFSHHGNEMIMLTLTCKFLQDFQVKALRVSHCNCLGLNIRLIKISNNLKYLASKTVAKFLLVLVVQAYMFKQWRARDANSSGQKIWNKVGFFNYISLVRKTMRWGCSPTRKGNGCVIDGPLQELRISSLQRWRQAKWRIK